MSLFNEKEILINLDETIKEKLIKIYYLEEFIDQIQNNPDLKLLIEETFEYLKEADIALTKSKAKEFYIQLFSKIKEYQLIQIELEEKEFESDNGELVEDEDEKETEGQCEMCLSEEKITLHHAIPKLILKRLKRKRKKAPVIYLKLCRECHSKLHATFPHAVLAKQYYTIEAVLQCEELQEYIKNKRRFIENKYNK